MALFIGLQGRWAKRTKAIHLAWLSGSLGAFSGAKKQQKQVQVFFILSPSSIYIGA